MPDVASILQAGSLLIIALVIFAESALLLGLLLPGDTLLIAGGILASDEKLPLWPLIVISAISTIIGYQVGYILGERVSPRIFKRKDGVLFREDYLSYTEKFFARHGRKTILIARFIAIVRTIVPLVAGMGKMNRRTFLIYNILGGLIWSVGLILLSYYIGTRVPNLDSYIKYLVIGAILLTLGSMLFEIYRHKGRRREIFTAIKDEYKYLFKKS
jgi:membrane-associated protein